MHWKVVIIIGKFLLLLEIIIPTFCGIYTHFDSFLPSSNKIGLLHTLLYRCFRICSDWTKFHLELVKFQCFQE